MPAPLALVTGASGLLGACLIDRLRARGVSMRLVDMVPPPDDRAAGAEFVQLDLRDAAGVARACRDVEVVHHLAAGQRMKPQFSAMSEQAIFDMNLDAVRNVLAGARAGGVRKVVHISSSGVYHPAGSPGDDPNSPPRGSKEPGKFFHYNNWDFNVLGAIFEKTTGKTVFAALDEELARPLQFQDFDLRRQRMMGFESRSRFLAYHLFLSARDMARLGLVMMRGGEWNGQQVVPAAWVKESTTARVPGSAVGRGGELGYGYLWWIPETRKTAAWAGAYMASGQFGQFILVLPAIDTVIVHRRAVTDEYAVARNLGKTSFEPSRVLGPDFLKLADMVVAAKS